MRALLVDLGSVVITHSWKILGEKLLFCCRQPATEDPGQFIRPLVRSRRYIDEFDLGHITSFEFYNLAMDLLRIRPSDLSYREFRKIYGEETVSLNEPMVELLSRMPIFPKVIASNINEISWSGLNKKYGELLSHLFDEAVLSFTIRARKPETEFFLECARRLGRPPENLYFIDDRGVNIEAARRLGIRSFQYDLRKHERAEKKILKMLYPRGY